MYPNSQNTNMMQNLMPPSPFAQNWDWGGVQLPGSGITPDPSALVTSPMDFSSITSMPSILGQNNGGVPGMPGMGGMNPMRPMGLGFNVPTAQLALSGLSTIGNLWGAFQAQKLAKQSFNFQRDYANTNLRNQTQSYNTQMEDRITSRAHTQGMSADQAREYLARNSLSTTPVSDRNRRG